MKSINITTMKIKGIHINKNKMKTQGESENIKKLFSYQASNLKHISFSVPVHREIQTHIFSLLSSTSGFGPKHLSTCLISQMYFLARLLFSPSHISTFKSNVQVNAHLLIKDSLPGTHSILSFVLRHQETRVFSKGL